MPSYLSQFLQQFFSMMIVLMGFAPAHGAWPEPNKSAPQGGMITFKLDSEPESLHPLSASDSYSAYVQTFVLDSLGFRDPNTYEWVPLLAEKWEISKDNKVFTFFLRKGVLYHDGKEMTAEDVKFSYEAIFEPKYKAFNLQPYYEGISKVEIVDPYTVKIHAKDTYFKNFDAAAGLTIIPKHIYGDVEKSAKMTRTLAGTGAYVLEKYDRGQKIVLKKFDKWHGKEFPAAKGQANFDRITFRFIKENQIGLEYLKKGNIDYMEFNTPEDFVQKTKGDPWGKSVLKFNVENNGPQRWRFVGFNFRKPMFQDKNVRLALYHLFNRELINEKFNFGMSLLATGPWTQKSDYASNKPKPVLYDPKKAAELLKKAGWTDSDKNGILDRTVKGVKEEFRFGITHSNKDLEKYLTIWKEDLKKAGIEAEIRYVEWQSYSKLLDEGKFDTFFLGWGGGSVEPDPKQIWHSSSAKDGGSNYGAYNNPEVDKLIDKARYEQNKEARKKMLQTVYEKIAEDVPYIFLFNNKYIFYATRDRIGRPGDSFKYGIGSGFDAVSSNYWWATK
ncbi:MAG: ABC transporter substrate-binding protein [Pseudobdellovibrionaceae bacterium]